MDKYSGAYWDDNYVSSNETDSVTSFDDTFDDNSESEYLQNQQQQQQDPFSYFEEFAAEDEANEVARLRDIEIRRTNGEFDIPAPEVPRIDIIVYDIDNNQVDNNQVDSNQSKTVITLLSEQFEKILCEVDIQRTIVLCDNIDEQKELYDQMSSNDNSIGVITEHMVNDERPLYTNVLKCFVKGDYRVLLTTIANFKTLINENVGESFTESIRNHNLLILSNISVADENMVLSYIEDTTIYGEGLYLIRSN